MNVYVESNYVLELSLLQEEHESCQHILTLSEQRRIQLIIPAYSLAEPNETLIRRHRDRQELGRKLQDEFVQFVRTKPNRESIDTFEIVLNLLAESGEQQKQRLGEIRDRLLQISEIIPLDKNILSSAANFQQKYLLSPQDAFVFASVIQHLNAAAPIAACFLTRNSKDFDDAGIRETLRQRNCKILFSFNDGYSYIQSQI